MTTTLDLLKECRELLWDRHDDDYAIDLRDRLDAHIARESAQVEPAHIGWRVVTWNSATDREFLTRPEALDYITMNDTDGDWHMEPIMPAAPPSAPLTDDNIKDVLIGTREELAAEVARLRAMLSTAPAVPTGWYACSERLPVLPADEEPVPVYTWDGLRVDEDEWSSQYDQPAGPVIGGWVRDGDWFDKDPSQQVTHWMPRNMPTPPKGE